MNLAHDRLAAMIYRRRFFNSLAFRYQAGDSLANLGAAFTRASTATYIDANGVLQTAASGVARDGHYIGGVQTLLLEGQRTNSFLNSGTPATHTSPSLGTGTYTLWMVGTGSIAVAGATATITGAGTATAAAPVTFTVTVAGTVTFTVTGSPTRAQCENGAFASSYIATAGSAVTRSADALYLPWPYVPQECTLYVKWVDLGTAQITSGSPIVAAIGNGFAGERFYIAGNNAGKFMAEQDSASVGRSSTPAVSPAYGDTLQFRAVLNADGSVFGGISQNGGAEVVGASSAALAFAAAWDTPRIGIGSLPAAGGSPSVIALQSVKVALRANVPLATMSAT